jgi:DNA-binding CsgD family transcriptional regulator
MNEQKVNRAKDKVTVLAGQGLDLAAFWHAASEVVAEMVPHYIGPCWYTFDPASLLVTSHYQPEMPPLPSEWLAHEYFADDVTKLSDTARSDSGYATIHEKTNGNPSASIAWQRFVAPYGGDQELTVALRTNSGEVWGLLGLYRQPGEPTFSEAEITFLRQISTDLALGAQRGLLVGEATEPDGPESPGLLILREDWTIDSIAPGMERWLDELPGGYTAGGMLPAAVMAVAGRALRTSERGGAPGEVAVARVLARSGRWVVLHGATLVTDQARRVAVIIEPAHPARIAALLMSAYGLSQREQDVTRLVLQGLSTLEITERLFVSAQTVQQHLKSIFEKTGVHSRRELTGKIFFAHYEPRLRDNEARTESGRPLRGGPMPASG